jgi:tRNA U34 5-carboxymethylaminomethyl modifying enzyme MnmG/GidA
MNGVAKVGDGSFYFIEKLDVVDEMFVDALGGLFSVLAQKVEISIRLLNEEKNN